MNISIEHNVIREPNTVSRTVDGEAIVITPENRTIHVLNNVGTKIWELVKEKKKIEDIVEQIRQEFKMDQGLVRKDVLEFVEKLHKKQMLEVTPQ